MDNRSVALLSTFASAEPLGECKRYDKKEKKCIMVPYPAIVHEYNQFMGGVDLMDALVALYRIHTRSKKYYHKFLFHFLDVTVVNCWLLYRRDCKDMQVPSKHVMMLQEFKLSVAEALLLEDHQLQNLSLCSMKKRKKTHQQQRAFLLRKFEQMVIIIFR